VGYFFVTGFAWNRFLLEALTRFGSFQAEPGTREFGFMANGLLQHSQGQRPWLGVSIILFGQRPCSTVMFWFEYGRWPKNELFGFGYQGRCPWL
jgi:hypothetical protein